MPFTQFPPLNEHDIKTLSRCALFKNLELDALLPLLQGQLAEFSAGHFLVQEGEQITRSWIVLSGTLHAARHAFSGREFLYQQLLPSYLAGGEVVVTPRKTAPYSIYAASDCRLWSFPWSLVEERQLPFEICFALIENMLTFVSNQNIRKYYKIDALSVKSARERIMKYLTAQAMRSRCASFTIPMDRESMANYLCLNRSVLSHELKKMESEGLITFYRNHFTLLEGTCPPGLPEQEPL